ncbi:a09af699-e234-43be-851e-e85e9dec5d91 [Sclerotinia trifoliorum]|uniref:A09af699-e234-43be-851e-e85e9dec5d91 n=1 Tax=Sclerotinia trifoliorum TaxID=28548 RepID=A0A8H2ZPP9_9HELO|nr:a09af699-e234-43be-851e-e85e9dec5d91 [Sclerotinia trifoliorum]
MSVARTRSMSMRSGHSSKGTGATLAEVSMPSITIPRDFEPCAATASMFLYVQGNTVVCCHHDTLKIERRFARHTEEIQLLAVDNISERGAGRLVVSYDAGQTAIVWDCMTGDEIARFASYENLTVAAWMRNGNVAFGNAQGNVILFEPTTSEHISSRTLDQIPITALAPAADCRTYAIGFSNGSLLIAALQPRFIILHNLTTSRGPSPIVTLSWHASSSRQKSDMLASQTNDGDLRVWSIAKSPTSNDTAKVVRVLKRSENFQTGPNWLGWSKNGRIIQFSEGETSSWDVRTKQVTFEKVPTLDIVKGLAVYGPGATLFTLGPNNTAQQFDLNSPPQMVANVQHPANLLPPSPPVSVEEQQQQAAQAVAAEVSAVPINIDISESDSDRMSPLARIARRGDEIEQQLRVEAMEPDRAEPLSPVSSRSHTSTSTRSSANSRQHTNRYHGKHSSGLSAVSRGGMSEATTMSFGSSIHTGATREPSVLSSRDSYAQSNTSSARSYRSRHRGSRLRQEVLRSPDEAGSHVVELFKYTKSRLSDIPYRQPQVSDGDHLTNDDLRLQMLSTIFGWDGEAEGLIRDEMNRAPMGSTQRVLLAKWIGDLELDIMATSSESMTSSDWMLLALSGIGGHASQTKVARAYVQRLLEKGDVHTAATIMLGMGDQNDAIEIYVSHKRFMEALILTSHVFPSDWSRQAGLIRKWGEWAVQHGQQQLAIRCFSCTASESSEPWTSPSAQAATFTNIHSQSIPEVLSPPLSPPSHRGPQRSIAKTSALKLITAFGDKHQKSKFFGIDNDKTPVGPGPTPIEESAISPGGDTAHTAFLRPGNRSVYHTPASARTATPGGFSRRRLPSIGETPNDVIPRVRLEPLNLPTPGDSGQYIREAEVEPLQLSSATYTPITKNRPTTPMTQKRIANPLPSPSPDTFTAKKQDDRTRNGSRHRKPDGLQIQWPPMESIITGDYMTSPEQTGSSHHGHRTNRSIGDPLNSAALSSAASVSASSNARSPITSERSFRTTSPVYHGRSIDQYISSLDSATYHKRQQRSRQASRDRSGRGRSSSRKPKAREASEDRGRNINQYIKPAKRSPTSPIPMSPEDLRDLGATVSDGEVVIGEKQYRTDSGTEIKSSRQASRVRRQSPEPSKASSRQASRNASRRPPSPDTRLGGRDARGRSAGRGGSAIRSPSSPLPFSPQAKFYQEDEVADYEDLRAAKADQLAFRMRSGSRMRERGTSAVRASSPNGRRRDRSTSRRPLEGQRSPYMTRDGAESQTQLQTQSESVQKAAEQPKMDPKDERALKREQAARELEERRKSLAQRPLAPPIIHPGELSGLSPLAYRPTTNFPEPRSAPSYSPPKASPQAPRSQQTTPNNNSPGSGFGSAPESSVQIGLPATPRAMRHPKYDPEGNGAESIPQVPQIPGRYDTGPQAQTATLSAAAFNASSDGLHDTFGPLPKTVYQASQPPRRMPPRSASAPIPEESFYKPNVIPAGLPIHPAFQAAIPSSSSRRTPDTRERMSPTQSPRRQASGDLQGETGSRSGSPVYASGPVNVLTGIDETIEAIQAMPMHHPNNDLIPPPPPPPPAPPLLPQLQHLALPPPPPPAPLYRPNANTNSMVSGVSSGSGISGVSSGSGVIEIVMDDEPIPMIPKSKTPTILSSSTMNSSSIMEPPPIPPALERRRTSSVSHIYTHNRGRSETDNSLSNRFSRAAERLRSASRGRNNSSPIIDKGATKSPIENGSSPYESVPAANWAPPPSLNRSATTTPSSGMKAERHPMEVRAAYQASMEGGMI